MENAYTVAYTSSDLQRSESQLQEDAGCLFVPQGSLATGPQEWGGAETSNRILMAVDMMEIAHWEMTSLKQVYYRIWGI